MNLTLSTVQNFLTDHLNNEISDLVPVAKGDWSQAFFFQVNNKNKVVRFSQIDEDFKKDQFAYRFKSKSLPIPKIEEIGQAFNGYFAISSKVEGEMIDCLNSSKMIKVLPKLFDLFNSLRKIDISQTSGYGGWNFQSIGNKKSWKEFLIDVAIDDFSSRINWREKLVQNHDVYLVFNLAYQEMLKLINFCPEDRHLIHNDLLHFNLLVNNNEIAGILDWGCSLYGDFLYDLAMFDLWQFYYLSMKEINFRNEVKKYYNKKGVNLPNFDLRLKCYQLHLAMDAIKYCIYKNNNKNLNLITNRIKKIIA